MQDTLLGSGQKIIRNILNWLQTSKDDRILDDNKNIFSPGILKDSHLQLGGLQSREFKIVAGTNNAPPAYKVKVSEGVAFDNNGERIVINTTDSTTTYTYSNINRAAVSFAAAGVTTTITIPLSTGSDDIPVVSGQANYIHIKYLENIDKDLYTTHKITHAKQFYKATDGYLLTVTTTATLGGDYLLLANVDMTSIVFSASSDYSIVTSYTSRPYSKTRVDRVGIKTVSAVSLTTSRTTTYTDDTNYLLDDHIKAVGDGPRTAKNPHGMSIADTGTPIVDINAEHQKLFHDNGIIDNTFSALAYGASGLVFKITNLTANQYVNIGTVNDVSNGVVTAAIINAAANSYEGAAAVVTCPTLEPYASLVGTTLILTFDGVTPFTVTFGAVGTTAALVAAYLNTYAGFSALAVATAVVGQLVITSSGAYNSSILIGNGTSNSIFGLTNGTLYEGTKTTIRITVAAGLTNNYIYLNNAGLFGYSATLPVFPNFPLYSFSTNTINITSTTDLRVFGTEKNMHTGEASFSFYRGSVVFSSIGVAGTSVTVITFTRPFTTTLGSTMLYFGCVVPITLNGSSFVAGANAVTSGISFTLSCTNNSGSIASPVTVNYLALGR